MGSSPARRSKAQHEPAIVPDVNLPADIARSATTDVTETISRWRSLPELRAAVDKVDQAWAKAPDVPGYAAECVTRASALARGEAPVGEHQVPAARICFVTKRPHVASTTTLTAIIARILAFGVPVLDLRRLTGPGDIGRALYPVAYRYFARLPSEEAIWDLLAREFDNPAFTAIFGARYSRGMVMTAHQAMEQFRLTECELTALWEEGRRPVSRQRLVSRYGAAAAKMILSPGQDSYQWFRGDHPIGIQRIAPGLMAFALRDERLGDGAPRIVLNGQFPGLAELFGAGTVIIQAGVTGGGPQVHHIRRWLVGADSRPARCQPGSLRRDAHDGAFETDGLTPVDSRMNILHCSDGLLTGMIESAGLFGEDGRAGALASELRAAGLTADEISSIVAADPVVSLPAGTARLTQLTRDLDLDDCVRTVVRLVPPVFGSANGYASGMSIAALAGQLSALSDGEFGPAEPPPARSLRQLPRHPSELPDSDEAAGRLALADGRVAFVVPAGGTGGRFGGYDLPEADPARQKPLLPCFRAQGEPRCALDIRVANASYWQRETGGRIPVAVMGSPTNYHLLRAWQAARNPAGAADIAMYQQFGTYRLGYPPPDAADDSGNARWVDRIVRHGDGTPSLKPPGNLGALTCLALSGILDDWLRAGVEFLAIANGDDVGFRLDPRILGYLRREPEVSAIVIAVPWGVQGTICAGAVRQDVRADVSGWCLVGSGRPATIRLAGEPVPEVVIGSDVFPLDQPAFDVGGWLCEVPGAGGWRPAVVESAEHHAPDARTLLSTNQIYLRVSALRDLMDLDGVNDVPAAVASFVARQPARIERKTVTTDSAKIEAVQVSQAMSGIFQSLSTVPMLINRSASAGQYGGHAPLKTEADVPFGQHLLDECGHRDQLAFD
jgi:hypothetical protein